MPKESHFRDGKPLPHLESAGENPPGQPTLPDLFITIERVQVKERGVRVWKESTIPCL